MGDAPWMIRPLRPDDLPLYRPLRLRALREHPSAFGADYEEEQSGDLSRMIGASPSVTLGGFADGALAGTAGLIISNRVKQRHKGHISAVYVAPAWRRGGLARGLLDQLVARARADGLSVLTLSVTVGNETAQLLYQRVGFTVYGVEPRSLRVGDDLLDEALMAMLL